MNIRHRSSLLTLAALCIAATTNASAAPTSSDLIRNGGFEAGPANVQSPDPITGWNSAELGLQGGVMVLDGNSSPVSGAATVGAAAGRNYALLDTAGLAQQALSQTFSLTQALRSATLSFDWFANYGGSHGAPVGSNYGLDYTSGGSYDSNVQLRVDILKQGASAFSTAAQDLVWSGAANRLSAGPNAYTHVALDLDGALFEAGQSYTLRFAAVSNDGSLVAGLDNVALQAVTAVPEPQTWALLAAGLGLLGMARRRPGNGR
ncbi:hypothetical protein HNP55_001403 [Paucibacter oligotrophus]|uniref:Ice-binding protein C-terminal domain-containing protein n=1 Tax=Roseateles oligotrophus TaxID=1769250 RepID=A0A840L9L7_9BURK|nr:PEP-CTERM sorting domain-containing protein [Roseateles oligotrophus]MBB4842888.1 hypothetical protein [Roseateles oligotrophus]